MVAWRRGARRIAWGLCTRGSRDILPLRASPPLERSGGGHLYGPPDNQVHVPGGGEGFELVLP